MLIFSCLEGSIYHWGVLYSPGSTADRTHLGLQNSLMECSASLEVFMGSVHQEVFLLQSSKEASFNYVLSLIPNQLKAPSSGTRISISRYIMQDATPLRGSIFDAGIILVTGKSGLQYGLLH